MIVIFALLAGCVSAPPVEPLYTQGSDLDLYASLADLGAMLRVAEGCEGYSTDAVSDRFIGKYYRRESAIAARLGTQYGTAALEGLDEIRGHPIRCEANRSSFYWRQRLEAVLATLERRTGLAP